MSARTLMAEREQARATLTYVQRTYLSIDNSDLRPRLSAFTPHPPLKKSVGTLSKKGLLAPYTPGVLKWYRLLTLCCYRSHIDQRSA